MNNNGKLLALGGKIGSGKSAAGKILESTGLWHKARFAHDLKTITYDILRSAGYSKALCEEMVDGCLKQSFCASLGTTPRRFMQRIGTEFIRGYGCPEFWCNLAFLRIKTKRSLGQNVFIDDIRFRDTESKRVKAEGGNAIYLIRDVVDVESNEKSLKKSLLVEELSSIPVNHYFRKNIREQFSNIFVQFGLRLSEEFDTDIQTIFSKVLGNEKLSFEGMHEYFVQNFLDQFIRNDMGQPISESTSIAGHISENLYGPEDADMVIINNGNLDDLRQSIVDCLALQDMEVIENDIARKKTNNGREPG